MKRIMVIGCPGSGKSVLSRELQSITSLPLYHLDNLYWNSDKTKVETPVFRAKLLQILDEDEWILDGNFKSTMEMRIQACDTVIFLDYPTELCLESVRGRIGQARIDIPWVEEKEDEEFMEYIRSFNTNIRPIIVELLEKHSNKKIVILKSRENAKQFLNDIR